jgi:UDP-N-acetylmuramate dehydrogenase
MGIIEPISQFVPKDNICENELMSRHTTFKVGGPCSILVKIDDVSQLRELLPYLAEEKIPYFFLGNGSNLLVSDKGYEGVVITFSKKLAEDVTVEGDKVIAGGGVLLSKVAKFALDENLTGFEFAAGIPGTVGGAMVMNAGAYDGEMKQIVETVEVIDKEGNLRVLSCEEMEFGYRTSILKREPLIVTKTTFKLNVGDKNVIKEKMDDLATRRRDKQPLEFPSAGSTFKRPEGHFAGKLIMDAGLRGYQVGGARVSEKHCGFVVNVGNATATDVHNLMEDVIKKVQEEFQVTLEPEVIRLGEF